MDAPSYPSAPKSSFRDAEKHLSGLDSQAIAILLEQASDIAVIIDRLGDSRLKAGAKQRGGQEQGAKARANAMKQADGRGNDRQHRRQ